MLVKPSNPVESSRAMDTSLEVLLDSDEGGTAPFAVTALTGPPVSADPAMMGATLIGAAVSLRVRYVLHHSRALPVRSTLCIGGRAVASAEAVGNMPVVHLAATLGGDHAGEVVALATSPRSELDLHSSVRIFTEIYLAGSGNDPPEILRLEHSVSDLVAGASREVASVTWTWVDGTTVHVLGRRPGRSRSGTAGVRRNVVRSDAQGRLVGEASMLTLSKAKPSAADLIATDLARPLRLDTAKHFVVDDLIFDLSAPRRSLPLVRDPRQSVFDDADVPGLRWACPTFEIVAPAPNGSPGDDSFAFDIRRLGTVSGPGGLREGLAATVRIRVRTVVPPPTGDSRIAPVPLGNLAACIDVPYRSPGQAGSQVQSISASVTARDDGTVDIVAELLDDWVRLAYGAISRPGFQDRPLRLTLRYAFAGYSPVDPVDMAVIVPLAMKMQQPEIDALLAVGVRNGFLSGARPEIDLVATNAIHLKKGVFASPPFAWIDELSTKVSPTEDLAIRTHLREAVVDVMIPCSTFGAWYREQNGSSFVSIGCADALTLGTTVRRCYEEMSALRTSRATVWRSLTQPGRFLVVPASYRIARYEADRGDSRAFRPAIHVSGAIDTATDVARYVMQAALQADVSPSERRAIVSTLRAHVPTGTEPQLDWPTDAAVGATCTTTWLVPAGLPSPIAQQSWEGFHTSVECSLTSALQLNDLLSKADGVVGSVRIALPDGTALSSRLVLDTRPCGPWTTGPATVTVAGAKATVVNRVERPVTVVSVVGRDAAGTDVIIPVGQTLSPGGAIVIAVEDGLRDAIADAIPDEGALPITSSNVYAQDIVVELRALNQCDLAARSLTSITVRIRLLGDATERALVLDADNPTAAVTVTLPITTYLDPHAVEWSLDVAEVDGSLHSTPWHLHRLTTDRGLITVTPERLPATITETEPS